VAGVSVRGENITFRASVDFASTLLAPDVPDSGDGVTVLALTKGGTTATVVEVDKGINTLVITTDQVDDRASRAALRARGNVAGAELTLLDPSTLVVVIAARLSVLVISILAISILALSILALSILALSILVVITVGFLGWSGGLGVGVVGAGWGRIAAKGAGAPVPALRALRRWEGLRRLVRSTAALSRVPRPVEGAVNVGGRVSGIAWSSVGKTDVLGGPVEFAPSTAVAVGKDEGDSQGQENDAGNERHFER
jgi:hypothetical protein